MAIDSRPYIPEGAPRFTIPDATSKKFHRLGELRHTYSALTSAQEQGVTSITDPNFERLGKEGEEVILFVSSDSIQSVGKELMNIREDLLQEGEIEGVAEINVETSQNPQEPLDPFTEKRLRHIAQFGGD